MYFEQACCLPHAAHLCEERANTLRYPRDCTFYRRHRFTTITCIQQSVRICTPVTIQPVVSGIETLGDHRCAPICNSRIFRLMKPPKQMEPSHVIPSRHTHLERRKAPERGRSCVRRIPMSTELWVTSYPAQTQV